MKSLIAMLESNWINPFSAEQRDLVCLSTGKVATQKMEEDLLGAKAVGEKAYKEYRAECLEANPPVKFHETLKKSKLKRFSDLNKKVKSKSKTANEIILKADRALFGQMVIIAENRQLHMRDVLCHLLGPLPWALSTVDGSLRKTSKAALAKELQKNVPAADLLIFDVNRENSIKNTEREHRGAEYGNEFRNLQPDHKVQQWRKFLLNPQNKKALTIFVTKEWKQDKYRRKLTDKVLFVACEEECHQISPEAAFTIEELSSTQEEADTRILLHLSHAALLKRGNIESDQLPPCADCLYKHACRANYQTGIWRRSLENCPEIPSPVRLGWI